MPPRTSRRRPGCRWGAGCLASAGPIGLAGLAVHHRAPAHDRRDPAPVAAADLPRWTTLNRGQMPSAPDAADLALHNLATQRAIALVSALPPLQAEVIMLRVVAGLGHRGRSGAAGAQSRRGQGGCPPRPSAACRNRGQRGCNAMTDPGVPHDDMLSFLWRSRIDIPQIGDEALDALLAQDPGPGETAAPRRPALLRTLLSVKVAGAGPAHTASRPATPPAGPPPGLAIHRSASTSARRHHDDEPEF
jgi:hypothetical protein